MSAYEHNSQPFLNENFETQWKLIEGHMNSDKTKVFFVQELKYKTIVIYKLIEKYFLDPNCILAKRIRF